MPVRAKAIAGLLLLSFIWGSTWLATTQCLPYFSPWAIAAIRNGVAGAALLLYFFVKGYALPTVKEFRQMAVLSFFLFTINMGFGILSVVYLPSYLAALCGILCPVIMYMIEAARPGHRVSMPLLAGFLLAIAGLAMALNPTNAELRGYNSMAGFGAAALAVAGWLYGSWLMKKYDMRLPVNYAFAWQLAISAVVLAVVQFSLKTKPVYTGHIPFQPLLALLYLSFAGTVLGMFLYGRLVQAYPISRVLVYEYVAPVFSLVLGIIILHEPVSYRAIAGMSACIAGVAVITKYSSKKQDG